MATKEILQRFTFDQTHVRGEIVGLQHTLTELFNRQKYDEPVKALLAELLAAAALLSATVKMKGVLTLQVQSNGPVRAVLAETTHDGHLRGIVRFDHDQPLDAKALLGDKGQMAITMDPEQGRRYQGIVALDGDNIAKSLEGYFKQSEQLGTRIWLGYENGVAAGMLLQELPELGEVQSHIKADADAWDRLTHLADTVRLDELVHLDNTDLLHRLYHEEQVRLYEPETLEFRCSCSKERLSNALTQIGYDQCQEIIDEQSKIRADCQFCGQHYSFDQSDVNGLFPLQSAKAGKGLH
ncbi:Hsp33 family molecular chaperone HslO [Bermanella sp. R86510]|uniref:Hsp33 family molecular chaperone HslO n=1 Tax=unclassified Bermanella TaxID=2627862 RepID=UPI0037CBBFA1